jgi:hypothetical protein
VAGDEMKNKKEIYQALIEIYQALLDGKILKNGAWKVWLDAEGNQVGQYNDGVIFQQNFYFGEPRDWSIYEEPK